MPKSTDTSWAPTDKQAEYLALPDDILEGFYAGAVGAGKSDVLLAYPIIKRWHENPKFKGIYFRRTFPELKNEIIPRSSNFYRQLGASYNKQDKVWEFPVKDRSKSPMGAGALLFFGHCENEDDVHKYDSMQINYAAFDELTSFTEWQYKYITLQRVRTTVGSGLPAIVRSASNPGNIGHTWVRERFIKQAPDGSQLLRNENGSYRIFIKALITDNPYIDKKYLQSLESLPAAEKAAKLYGDWSAYDGQVFDEFRDRKFPDEPENAIHVIKRFDIPDWWPKIVACDWGFAPPAMTWMGYGAISPERRLYLYREQAWQKTRIEEWCAQAKPFLDRENPRVFKLCKSAGQDRGQEHTIHSQVESALGRPVELTSNSPGSRVSGKMLMHEYFRWKQKYIAPIEIKDFDQEHAAWILRNRNEREYRSYLDSFSVAKEETNIPKFQVFDTCPLFVNAIKSCVYDKTNVQDVAEFPGDDPYDGGRYLIDAADRFFESAVSEFQVIQQREALTKQLQATGDMTAFYRNARTLESQNRPQSIARYRRMR